VAEEQFQAEGASMKRYVLYCDGVFVGTYDTAKETVKTWEEDREPRRVLDPEHKHPHYRIWDRQQEITPEELRRTAAKEEE
jgi:hypothetical protein